MNKDNQAVHEPQNERRVPRGIRMAESLWEFVDHAAGMTADGNASALIERWVTEKREDFFKVA